MQIKTTTEILDLVSEHPDKDSLLYFTHLIIKRNTNKSTYLSSQALKKTFGDRSYTQLRTTLVELGILEVFSNYREGGYQFLTYKVLVPHSKKQLIDYTITSVKLINRINYIIENNFSKLTPKIKQILTNLEKLVITPELLIELRNDGVQLEDEVIFTNNSIFKARISQSATGRVHHTLTNLNKKYRRKLCSKLGNLVEIDAKNAQLIFLSQLCPNDLAFNADVFAGVFYERLAEKMGVDLNANKDRFKESFFNTILCNDNKAIVANSKYSEAFKVLYPAMYNFLLTIDNGDTKASTLQKLEAEFFITNILTDIVNKGLFVIPVHDAVIILEKDIDEVKSIIDVNSDVFFKRTLSTSITHHTSCPTPYDFALLIKEAIIDNNTTNKCICSAKGQGVGQNKNQIKTDDTINKITLAIKELKEDGVKITIRSIQAKSGVSKKSIEKHYKAILSTSEIETTQEPIQEEIVQAEASIMTVFRLLADTHSFPEDITEFYIKYINNDGFDTVAEMIDEVNIHPILKHIINTKQIA